MLTSNNRKKALLLVLTAAIGLAGCGSSKHHYPDQAVNSFTTGCVTGTLRIGRTAASAANYCRCVLEKLEAHVSYEQFAAVTAAENATGRSSEPPKWTDYELDCADSTR